MEFPTYTAVSELSTAISRSLSALTGSLARGLSNRTWTSALKEKVATIGKEYRWEVCTSGFSDRFECEWLYDLVLYRTTADGYLREIGLVLESEWDPSLAAIKYDFEKLLLAKSPLKVMIFQGRQSDLDEKISLLKESIKQFSAAPSGELYMLFAFSNEDYAFRVEEVRA